MTHKRQLLLRELIDQIFTETNHFKDIQLIVVNNDERDLSETTHIDKIINQKFRTPAAARNEALKYCSHEWVLFLDDDILLGHNFISKSIEIINNNPLSVVLGGPDQTPPDSNYFAKSLGLALTSPMTTASTRYRHTKKSHSVSKGDEKSLILCNLWVNRAFLDKHEIKFNEEFFRNEENILINQILAHQGQCLYSSQLYVYHYRKSNFSQLASATFSSAICRVKSFKIDKNLFSFIFIIPALWICYLVALPFLPFESWVLLKIYLILSFIFTLKSCVGNVYHFPMALVYQFYINIIYGLGILFGLFRSFF